MKLTELQDLEQKILSGPAGGYPEVQTLISAVRAYRAATRFFLDHPTQASVPPLRAAVEEIEGQP